MMNKPLKDWTLGEMQAYCNNTDCKNACWLYGRHCYCPFLVEAPGDWDLSTPPRWTAEDIADAKAVKRVHPWAVRVCRDELGGVHIYDRIGGNIGINVVLLPGLRTGETVDLQEILDAEGQENGQADV